MTDGPIYGGQPDSFVVAAAATVPIAGKATPKSWLDYEHPEFSRLKARREMASDFYLGEVADKECSKKYLIKRYQGEPDLAFQERVKNTDYTPHLGTLIDTLAGMLFATEDRTSRVWTDDKKVTGLGDPNEAGTPSSRLIKDADGQGTGWKTLWREFTLDLIVFQCMWVLVDTVDGVHYVKLVSPMHVPNWVDGPHGPSQVLMSERRDQRTTLEDSVEQEQTYIRWEQNGWSRWRKTKEGEPEKLTGGGTYKYTDRNGKPILPIFRVELPMRRYVAWLLANKAAVLFNQESVRDFSLRNANFSKLVVGIEGDGSQFEDLSNRILRGENILPEGKDARGAHRYINPSSEPTKNSSEVLDKKVEHFWISGFKMYADAAAQKTATEVKQDVASGIGAFLQLLAAAVDDAENGAFWRLEQAEYSESENKWGVSRVERSDDFSTVDLAAVLDQMKKRYISEGGAIPLGRAAMIQLAKDSAQQDGLPIDNDEIAVAVDAQLASKYLKDLNTLGTIPPLVKARLTMRFVAALGLVEAEEQIENEEGEKVDLFDQLMAEAEEQAVQQQEAEKLQSQMPPFGG